MLMLDIAGAVRLPELSPSPVSTVRHSPFTMACDRNAIMMGPWTRRHLVVTPPPSQYSSFPVSALLILTFDGTSRLILGITVDAIDNHQEIYEEKDLGLNQNGSPCTASRFVVGAPHSNH
ncbi:hypothetical protein FRC16_004465 [Serendipita sp. 398]|nr:hypothetical protein FRC16_004465 [Serendipita sp. 398]